MNALAAALLALRFEAGRRLGAAGAGGIVLIAVALVAALVIKPEWSAEAIDLQARAARARVDAERRSTDDAAPPSIGEQLAEFTGRFAPIDQNGADLRRIVEQADKVRLALGKGDYRISSERGTGFVHYDVILPVKDRYDTIRRFIAGVLTALPHASLAELRLERPAANSTVLDARLHFTLIYRGI